MRFILAQVCGILTLIINVTCVHFKSKDRIMIFQIITNSIEVLQFLLLNGTTGAILCIINISRCIVFYRYKKKDKKPSVVVLIFFIALAVLLGVITWQNVYSIIPIIASILSTYAFWQDNVKMIKIGIACSASSWVIYDIIVKAYTGAIQMAICAISSIIAIVKHKKDSYMALLDSNFETNELGE